MAAAGGRIAAIYYCPHGPQDNCDCRKPEPGLIYQARKKYMINLASAVMVGDSAKDIECAHRAGCGRALLVKSGKDDEVEDKLKTRQIPPILAGNCRAFRRSGTTVNQESTIDG